MPTMKHGYSRISSSVRGTPLQKSVHHFFRVFKVSAWYTSKARTTASAPLKSAVDRLENLSWPAVSYFTVRKHRLREQRLMKPTQICNVTFCSGFVGWGIFFEIKSAPIVAL